MTEPAAPADELLRALILKRFGEAFGSLPHSRQFHLLHCDTREVAEVGHKESFSCCESCPYVEFTAPLWCEHVQVEWAYGEPGTLASIIADMTELAGGCAGDA